jgi:hypothetical protein
MIENVSPQQLVEFIGHTSAALEKAQVKLADFDALKQQREKANGLIPEAVAALLEHNRIQPFQKAAAEEALRDPVQTLRLITTLAGHRNEKEAAAIGRPVDSNYAKVAAYSPIGGRSSDMRDSDKALFAAVGLPVPN